MTIGEKLDEMEKATEKLFIILKQREIGLMTWNEALRIQMYKVQKLLNEAMGPINE